MDESFHRQPRLLAAFLLHGFLQLLEEGELLVDVGFLFVLLEAVLQVLEGGLCLGDGGLDILAAGRLGCRRFVWLIPAALESFNVGALDEAGDMVGLVVREPEGVAMLPDAFGLGFVHAVDGDVALAC